MSAATSLAMKEMVVAVELMLETALSSQMKVNSYTKVSGKFCCTMSASEAQWLGH